MENLANQNQLMLFRSLFKGREDVFALRWEKANKNGYMPAYSYDPYVYQLYKQKGGTFKDYKDKTLQKLDDYQLSKHLTGEKFIGIYPLLKDNTSWFIVADFDKKNWEEQSKKAINACEKFKIPAYLERSRSGNGGHVWVFFDKPYPAIKSRRILLSLFEQTGVFSVFDKNTSFDRLFPNQDYLSGKGFGNLIALPFHGKSMKQGNCCFISTKTLIPYKNQWQFISKIKKVSVDHLDDILKSIPEVLSENVAIANSKTFVSTKGKLVIKLTNCIVINRNGLTPLVTDFLKQHLNFYNSEFFAKKKSGRSTWKTDRFFKLIEETENTIEIPKGFVGKLIRFCRANKIDYEFQDQRKKAKPIEIISKIQLLKHQITPLEVAMKKDFGIIVAPPGSGKTIIGLKLIEQKKQPALIFTHRKQIAEQWIDSIQTFFGIPKKDIGKIGQGKMKIGKQITVALIQTLAKKLESNSKELTSAFGIVIIDECHHIPSKSFREAIHHLYPYYQYGLTATPFRKNNDEKILFIHLGDIISEIKPQQIETYKKARLTVRDTNLDFPFNSKTDHFETLSKVLIHDSERNKLILKDIYYELDKGRKIVIITERKEHILVLHQYLKNKYEVIPISGEDNAASRKLKWNSIKQSSYQAIITTGQFFGEGIDIQDVSGLFLVYPFAFKGKLIQYIGRVQRSELTPIIYDYRDKQIPYLDRLFLKRNIYYRNLEREATLFDDFEEVLPANSDSYPINKNIRILIEEIEFHYGLVSFSYPLLKNKTVIQFEIENEEIQPEFEVLKPYFIKVLESKYISVHIQIEIKNNCVISQLANSADIDRINKEVVDGVKFQFIEQEFLRKGDKKTGNPEEVLRITKGLFDSDNNLMESLLEKETYLHHRHLKYLAKHHDHKTLKMRFVLHPFSFIFLIEGQQNNHIILETLNSKEATYVWHLSKNPIKFKDSLKQLNKILDSIKNNGRQNFLKTNPENFSKILHEYNEEEKGFYRWKNALDERIF